MNGKEGRKRPPGAPVYSPNETLNQMTKEADHKQEDTLAVQKEARAIRAIELEKQRKQEQNLNESDSCENSSSANTRGEQNPNLKRVKSDLKVKPTFIIETCIDDDSASDHEDTLIKADKRNAQNDIEIKTIPFIDDEEDERDEESPTTYNHNANGRYSRASSVSSSTALNTSTGSNGLPRTRLFNGQKSTDSTENLTISNEDNPRELRKKLNEMEEKHKKHAMYQTQLENDNQKLIYEVDILKDTIEEYEESVIELRRQFKEKHREVENQKRTYKDLSVDFDRLKEILTQRDALIENSGLILYTDNEQDKDQVTQMKSILPAALLSPETAQLLDSLGDGTIDDKLKKLLNEKQKFKEQIVKLTSELDEERFKCTNLERRLAQSNSKLSDTKDTSIEMHEMQRTLNREINELKNKNQRLEHDNFLLREEKARVDAQIRNLQKNLEEMNEKENILEKEKRDLRRELNEANNKISDLQTRLDVLRKTQRTRQLNNRMNLASTPMSGSSAAGTSSSSLQSANTTSAASNHTSSSLAPSLTIVANSASSLLPSSPRIQLSFDNDTCEQKNLSADDSSSSQRDDSISSSTHPNPNVNSIMNSSRNNGNNVEANVSDTNDDERNNSNTSAESSNSSSTHSNEILLDKANT